MLVLDSHKGLSFVLSQHGKHEKVATNGFDRLNWDVHLDPKDEEAEASSGTEEAAEPKKLSRKMKKELKLQKKANARRLRLAKRGISEAVLENTGFNEYTAKQEIKRIHNRIVSRMPLQGVSDFKVFHYESIAFYKSDVDHLVPGEWLNDNNIALVYELLTKYFLKETPFGHEVLLLYPSLVQLFLHYPSVEEVASILPQKELSKLKLVFIPFNFVDSMIDLEDANNGDHWALCVLSIMEKRLYVFDSMSSEDDHEDEMLLRQLAKRLQSAIFKPKDTLSVMKMPCDQQDNFDDCGVFCIMFTVYLVAQVISGEPIDIDIRDVNFNALSGRLFMMELVKRLSEKDGPN
uniref:Ubiquitin-like protease family profile domain-containing protein n=1 Tax=Candidozyma auris TaxID=498019 RepID=A0A0L0NTB1_CANAR